MTVVLDHAAVSKLPLTDYFRAVYATKPHWQGI
jgi:glucosamine-6-phosphate deaminase